jgi:hypothetical protein
MDTPPGASAPGRWLGAEDVQIGDQLLLRNGQIEIVETVGRHPFLGRMYNLSVAELECYAVGCNSVLVHNMGDSLPPEGTARDGPGSYTNTHASGKTYSGKGGPGRMQDSANRIAKEHGDPVVSKEHTPSSNTKVSFIDEQNRIEANGGPGGNTYNKINSPGKKLRDGP